MSRKWVILAVFAVIISLFAGTALASQPVTVYVNGKQVECDTPAQIINGRTMVPVRFVVEALGAEVNWLPNNNRVIITTKEEQTLNLIKLDGEPTTWPYWYENEELYMEYRDVLALLSTKYRSPWYSVNYHAGNNHISLSNKSVKVTSMQQGDFTAISLNSLQREGIIKFEWDPENENLVIE